MADSLSFNLKTWIQDVSEKFQDLRHKRFILESRMQVFFFGVIRSGVWCTFTSFSVTPGRIVPGSCSAPPFVMPSKRVSLMTSWPLGTEGFRSGELGGYSSRKCWMLGVLWAPTSRPATTFVSSRALNEANAAVSLWRRQLDGSFASSPTVSLIMHHLLDALNGDLSPGRWGTFVPGIIFHVLVTSFTTQKHASSLYTRCTILRKSDKVFPNRTRNFKFKLRCSLLNHLKQRICIENCVENGLMSYCKITFTYFEGVTLKGQILNVKFGCEINLLWRQSWYFLTNFVCLFDIQIKKNIF